MQRRTRIGAVAYLNTRPLVHGLEAGLGRDHIELSYDVPAVLADRMALGTLDVALLPVIELARQPDLEIVPGLGIVTQGPSRSVLLISRCEPQQIDSLALDPESRTSNVLAQVLLHEVWHRKPSRAVEGSRDLATALQQHDAAIRIGDKALFEPVPEGLHVHDLGQVWTEHSGLPFVFAAWIARRGSVDRQLYRWLHESHRQGRDAIDAIAADYTWQGRTSPEIVTRYLTRNIRYRLGAAELRGIERFLDGAAACGLIDHAPALQLAFGQDSGCHDREAERRTGVRPDEVPHA